MEDGVSTYSVDEALVFMGFGKFHAFVLAYSGMAKISEAMEMMLLSFVGQSVQAEWELSAQAESLITSVVFVGMLVGAYAWGIVSDNYGRRHVLPYFVFFHWLLRFYYDCSNLKTMQSFATIMEYCTPC